MIPIRNDNPIRTVPFVTRALIAFNLAVFVYELSLDGESLVALVDRYGIVPVRFWSWEGLAGTELVQACFLPFLTALFLHGGWLQEKLLHLAAYRIGLAAHVAQLNAQRAPRSGKESPSIEVAYRANLLEMSRAAKQHKTSLMFMVWPLLPQVFELQNRPVPHAVLQRCKSRIRMQSVMREVAASQGITVVDPLPALAASPEHPTYLAMIHANEKGLATIAGVLKQAVLEHVRKRHRPATP